MQLKKIFGMKRIEFCFALMFRDVFAVMLLFRKRSVKRARDGLGQIEREKRGQMEVPK